MNEPDSGGTPAAGSPRAALRPPVLVLAVAVVVAVLVGVLGYAAGANRRSPAATGGCDPVHVASDTMASVVTILVKGSDGAGGNGSGEFLDAEGHVLTNNHVISAAAVAGTITVLRPNGTELPATLVGRDPQTDLAVLKVTPESPVVPVRFGTLPAVGSVVFAIGAPLGLSDTFTAGVVSSLGRSVRVPSDNGTTALLVSAIQTDAAINPGNSGGMLANCSGELVGVPTAGTTANDSLGQPVAGSIGLGFAIPAATAQRVAEVLIDQGRIEHGDFGLSVVPIASGASAVTPSGLYISAVTPSGPAARAGLRAGDIITAVDDQEVSSADKLQEVSLSKTPGTAVTVTFQRAGRSADVTLTLGRPPQPR
jgi:putative serine protease PepD